MFPCAFEDKTRILQYWERDENDPIWNELRYDASYRLKDDDRPFFHEHEHGNHPILLTEKQISEASPGYHRDTLNYKLDRYVKHFEETNFTPFVVTITVEDWHTGAYDKGGTERLFENVYALLQRYRRGDDPHAQVHFLVARHRAVVGDKDATPGEIHNERMGNPFGRVWLSAVTGQYMSLLDV